MQIGNTSIAALRNLVDLDPYTPDATSPEWLQGLFEIVKHDPGVLALLGPTGLGLVSEAHRPIRLAPDVPTLLLTSLVDRIRSTQRHVAIGVLPVARHLPLLLAGSSVLANVVDRTGIGPGRSDGSILIVSPDLHARSRYCDLHVGLELLDTAYPGCRMRPDGQRIPLGSVKMSGASDDMHGVCFFLPSLSLPRGIAIRPSTIVLDVRYARWVRRISDLTAWAIKVGGRAGIAALYTIGDSETRDALVGAGFIDFPFDQCAILNCARHTPEPITQNSALADLDMGGNPNYLERRHDIVFAAPSTEVERALLAASRLVFERHQDEGALIRRARWILAMLNNLPVPVVVYEYSARALGRKTLHSLIDGLGTRRTSEYGAGGITADVGRIQDALRQAYAALWQLNPRVEALRAILPRIASESDQGKALVLVRDIVVERALQSWIADEEFPDASWIGNLDVVACSNFTHATESQYRHTLLIGAFARRYSWIVGAPLAPQVTIVAYPHEVEVIRRQLDAIYSAAGHRERATCRDSFIQALVPHLRPSGEPDAILPPLSLNIPSAPSSSIGLESPPKQSIPRPKVTIRDLSQLGAALQQATQIASPADDSPRALRGDWDEDIGDEDVLDDEPLSSDESELGTGEPVLSTQVQVHSRAFGLGSMWLARDRPVEVYRQTETDGLMVTIPRELKPGDVLLVMRDLERTSLFDRIVQLAEAQPGMRFLTAHRKVWQDAVRRMATRYTIDDQIDFPRLLRDLQAYGATIQSELAVRFWVQGSVIGPGTVQSIIAVGKVSGYTELVQRAREFDQAFRHIRGVRQGLGMRLSTAIRQAFRRVAEGETSSKSRLSDHLGIAIDELIDSIDLAEVLMVGAASRPIPAQLVGRFQPR